MEALKNAAEQARAGHGQIVAAMAEPGVGKSRLFYEFKMISQSGWMVLDTFSVSHGKAAAHLPVIELLHGYFGIEAGDDGRKRREKVTGRVLTLGRRFGDTTPYLFSLLGMVENDDPLAQMDSDVKRPRITCNLKEAKARRRVKIWGRARVVADDPQLLARLMPEGYDARPEQAILSRLKPGT